MSTPMDIRPFGLAIDVKPGGRDTCRQMAGRQGERRLGSGSRRMRKSARDTVQRRGSASLFHHGGGKIQHPRESGCVVVAQEPAWPPRRRGLFLFIPHENPSWILVKIDSILLASKLLTLPRRSARGFFWTSVELEAALL
jgi:hypothetical protein